MTAPTEQEIRAVVEREFVDNGSLNAAGRLSDAFAFTVLDALYDPADMRESEDQALRAIVYDATNPILERVIVDVIEALVAAGIRFAAAHPDAPRAAREAVPA